MQLDDSDRAAAAALIELAFAEDLGESGDRTSMALIPETQTATATFVARRPGTLAGLPVATMAASRFDSRLVTKWLVNDGAAVAAAQPIGSISGPLRAILAAERTVLNFLQRLSGVATLTRAFVDAAAGTHAAILDTRKTTPGWRRLEKYAVRCGGGRNHRFGLYDALLIKDNHIAGVGGDVAEAVQRARAHAGNAGLPVEIEVDSLTQLEAVLAVRPEIVLLDNMSVQRMTEAVTLRDRIAPGVLLEASGGINLQTVRAIAETGVDRISIGALTHSAPALDLALDLPA